MAAANSNFTMSKPALAPGTRRSCATNYPNQRLYIISRSGFAGDQRFGAAHWSNDVGADLADPRCPSERPLQLQPLRPQLLRQRHRRLQRHPDDELYVRWFQFGAFCPGLPRARQNKERQTHHALRVRRHRPRHLPRRSQTALPPAPLSLHRRRETTDTGLPICRPLPLAYSGRKGQNDGSEFLFGESSRRARHDGGRDRP